MKAVSHQTKKNEVINAGKLSDSEVKEVLCSVLPMISGMAADPQKQYVEEYIVNLNDSGSTYIYGVWGVRESTILDRACESQTPYHFSMAIQLYAEQKYRESLKEVIRGLNHFDPVKVSTALTRYYNVIDAAKYGATPLACVEGMRDAGKAVWRLNKELSEMGSVFNFINKMVSGLYVHDEVA